MKTRAAVFLLVSLVAIIFSSSAWAACPCHPCKCSPCTCGGGKGGGGGGKHHDKGHDRGGGSSVGVGVSVDLSGVGHRNREADPFSVGGGETHHSSTEEKSKVVKHETPVSNPFNNCHLTGDKAKELAATEGNTQRAPQNQ